MFTDEHLSRWHLRIRNRGWVYLGCGGVTMACGGCGQGVIEQVAHGVAGLAKAALRIDRTPPTLMELRVRQCIGHPTGGEDAIEPCPAFRAGFMCEDCGCIVAAKLRIASEVCPRGRWPVGE